MQSTPNHKDDFPTYTAARVIIVCAIALGIAAERLLKDGIVGGGWPLWISLFSVSAVIVVRQAHFAWFKETVLAAAVAVGAALIPAIRASETLHLLSMLVLVTAASVPLLSARSFRLGETPFLAQLLGLGAVAGHAAGGALFFARPDARGSVLPARVAHRSVGIAARGALLALPPLAVFGALFVSADPLFERYVQNAVRVVTQDVVGRIIIAGAFAWVAAGLLRGLLPARSVYRLLPPAPTLPAAEVGVALGAITALFAAFVFVQARWLFDSAHAIEATTGLTVADYARRGFFELVAASALALPMLLVCNATTRSATPAAVRTLRVLTVSLAVLVLIVMASALERMALYTSRFGLTEQRLYTVAFMGWLAVVFAWFLITVARGRRRRFAVGPLVAGVVAVLALAAVNPDALIARVNLERARSGATLDAAYLTRLSADAVPVLLSQFDAVPVKSRCDVAKSLLRYESQRPADWRSANRSRERARVLVAQNATGLKRVTASCAPS